MNNVNDKNTTTYSAEDHLKHMIGLFEEQYHNNPKESTISKNAQLCINLMLNVFGEVLIDKEK